MIVDCHCHAGIGDGLTGPWDTDASLNRYLIRARRAGIDLTFVFPVFNRDDAAANERLASIVAKHPTRLVGFAVIDPDRDRGRVATMVGHAVTRFGFRGIKVHGHDAGLSAW